MLRRTLQSTNNNAKGIFLRPFEFSSNKQIATSAFELNDQQRTTVTSNLGRMRVNMSRVTKKIDDMLHPHPDTKAKKFQLKKRYVRPAGETKASQRENNEKINPAGVAKPQKITERNLELIKAIYECGNTHQPELAIEAYRRLSTVPDIKCFNAILKSMELNGDYIGEAFQIYQDIKKIHLPANITTFSTLLNVCVAANHWQRAMNVLKEMLNIAPPPARPDKKQHKKFFAKLLQLLHKNQQHERIAYVYRIMLDNDCIGVKPATHKSAPVAFVQTFIPKFIDAEEYNAKTLAGLLDPSKGFSYETNQEQMEYLVHPLATTCKNELEDAQRTTIGTHESIKSAVLYSNNLEFNFEMEDRTAAKQFKALHTALVNEFLPDFVESLTTEEPAELYIEELRDVPKAKATAALTEKKLQMYINTLEVSHDFDAIEALHAQYKDDVNIVRDELATKLPWKPVIVGVDGKPFFPTKITVHKITGETVKAAKDEYLQSIEDPATRKEVEGKLKDRIRLCWYSAKTGKLVQGLFY